MDSQEEQIMGNGLVKPLVWWHYIDDIFMMWVHTTGELQKFLALNCCHPTIKFMVEYSRVQINFLDITVMITDFTDLYIKPTDIDYYLYASLCHLFHCKESIPFNQTLHLNRFCSENTFFDKGCNELEVWLKTRGYSDKLGRGKIFKARKF